LLSGIHQRHRFALSLMAITRTWMINDLGGAQINPNRTWPGREDGNTVERHSWLITNKLIKGNVDAESN
jgi:predicted deacylase